MALIYFPGRCSITWANLEHISGDGLVQSPSPCDLSDFNNHIFLTNLELGIALIIHKFVLISNVVGYFWEFDDEVRYTGGNYEIYFVLIFTFCSNCTC